MDWLKYWLPMMFLGMAEGDGGGAPADGDAETGKLAGDGDAAPADGEGEAEAEEAGEGEPDSALSALDESLGIKPEGDAAGGEPKGPEGEGKDPDKPADGPGAAEGAAANPPGESDPFEGDLEEGVTERTRARFEQMVTSHNELKTSTEELTARHQGLVDVLNETGASTEELAKTLDYLRLRRSETPADLRTALQLADAERADIARRLGEELPGMDLLSEHPDLATRVENMELTREDALELVRARDAQRHAQTIGETARNEAEATAQYQQSVAQGVQALDTMDMELRKDPDYAAKRGIVDQYAQNIFQTATPDQWAAIYRGYWDIVGKTVQAKQTPPPGRGHQPVSRGGAGTGATREASTAQEALDAALGIPLE